VWEPPADGEDWNCDGEDWNLLAEADATLLGQAPGDGAGVPLVLGDLDGDGLSDVVAGASGSDLGGSASGATFVIAASGLPPGATLGLSGADRILFGEEPGSGVSDLSADCDFDGDGVADLTIGSQNSNIGGVDAGAVFVFFGPVVVPPQSIGLSSADVTLLGEVPGDKAGYRVACAGDVDGDGLDDLLVGAQMSSAGGTQSGKAYVVLGSTVAAGGTLSLADADVHLPGETANDGAGRGLAGRGDVDGDGLDDVLIGSPAFGTPGPRVGKAYLLLGATLTGGGPVSLSNADAAWTGEEDNDLLGSKLVFMPDFDGDGYDEVAIAAYNNPHNDTLHGAVYVELSGSLGFGTTNPAVSAWAVWRGTTLNDRVGISLSSGDVDDDGLGDLLVGALEMGVAGIQSGAYLLTGASMATGEHSITEADAAFLGEAPGDYSYEVVGGDVDGDGRDDLVVGAAASDEAWTDAGKLYVLLSWM